MAPICPIMSFHNAEHNLLFTRASEDSFIEGSTVVHFQLLYTTL